MSKSTPEMIEGCDPDRLRLVCESLGIRLLVLFGSRAPGGLAPRPESDLDLAVLPGIEGFSAEECFARLSEACPVRSVDVLSLVGGDPLLRWEVMRAGVLVHGDVDDFLEYRAFAFRDLVDSDDLRELEDVLVRKKMEYLRSTSNVAP